ncbi:MAG: ribosome recycling factor [Candidatus Kerfeldbacteria bacterium]|nr:ribosome recycling factor [Candidatus Kerfeldbacteria bacterium]
MQQIIEQAKPKFAKVLEHLKVELSTIRSGRANPALVEQVKVEAYGTVTPLIELASITAPEPRLLVVQPWDKGIMKDVERALQAANVGASPVIEGQLIRLNLPALTEERRRELLKLVKTKLEEGRVAVRNVREEVIKQLKEQKTKGTISEDDFFMAQKDLQKLVDEVNEQIKKHHEAKEKEIMTI